MVMTFSVHCLLSVGLEGFDRAESTKLATKPPHQSVCLSELSQPSQVFVVCRALLLPMLQMGCWSTLGGSLPVALEFDDIEFQIPITPPARRSYAAGRQWRL